MTGFGFEAFSHLPQDIHEAVDGNFPFVTVQYLEEARHVRALEVVGQVHVHVEVGDGVLLAARTVLNAHRVKDFFHANAVDGNLTGIGTVLYVFNRQGRRLDRNRGGSGGHGESLSDGSGAGCRTPACIDGDSLE